MAADVAAGLAVVVGGCPAAPCARHVWPVTKKIAVAAKATARQFLKLVGAKSHDSPFCAFTFPASCYSSSSLLKNSEDLVGRDFSRDNRRCPRMPSYRAPYPREVVVSEHLIRGTTALRCAAISSMTQTGLCQLSGRFFAQRSIPFLPLACPPSAPVPCSNCNAPWPCRV